jgi:hypothetical protein
MCVAALVAAVVVSETKNRMVATPDSDSVVAAGQGQPKQNYGHLLDEIMEERGRYRTKYIAARTDADRKRIVCEARDHVYRTIVDRILPCWYGTAWEFNGSTDTPGVGAIACGTFVGTVLRDAGFNTDRIAQGRQPSEDIIKNFTSVKSIRRYSNAPVSRIETDLQAAGDGLYVVGLDIHAGLITVKNGQARFVHSSYYPPQKVVSESLSGHNPFNDSKYRVTGRILEDEMIRKWISEANPRSLSGQTGRQPPYRLGCAPNGTPAGRSQIAGQAVPGRRRSRAPRVPGSQRGCDQPST